MFTYMRHSWPKAAGWSFEMANGSNDYTFMHFFNSVDLLVNGELITTKPNACIFYGPTDHQYYVSHVPLLHDHLHATLEAGPLLEKYNIKTNYLYYPDSTYVPQITKYVKKIEYEHYYNPTYCEDVLNALAVEFFVSFSRAVEHVDETIPENQVLIGVRHNVMTHISKRWTVEEMARFANLSPSRFHTLYKDFFGISPINDLINTRVATSKGLLENSSMQINQIAEYLGYTNPFHFIRQFKKLEGITPSEYRKTFKAGH
ncbi:MAG: helix-turn-helix transcriptional regulator [Clostridia bacterium]|nr:helix-turn-helix transcriptional regulator [Clostridia bacterium]